MRKITCKTYPEMMLFTLLILLVFMVQTSFSQKIPKSFNIATTRAASALDATPKSNTIEKVLLVGDTIWIASSKGLSKSTNDGIGWTNYYDSAEFGTESISAIAFANGIFCASTWHYEETSTGRFAVGSGIKISTNYGKSWTKIPQMVDNNADSLIVYGTNSIKALPVTTTVQNFIRDIAIVNNTIWIASNSAGLRKSTDMGVTWQRVILPPDNLDSIKPSDQLTFQLRPKAGSTGNLNHIGFAILAIDKDTLYAGTAGGINKTTDGGISWIKFSHTNQNSPISGNHILKIRQNQFDKSIWAATWKAEDQNEFWGVSYTYDSGKTWKVTLNDSRTLDFVFPEIKSGSVTTSADVIALTQEGLYRTSNKGNNWIISPKIKDLQTNILMQSEYFLGGAVNNQKSPTELWFGTLDGLARLKQLSSDFWEGDWNIFFVSAPLQSKDESYAFPTPFSPGSETVRIKYSLQYASNVTIQILDFGMNLVKTLIQNAPRNAGTIFDLWNGRDDKGNTVPNGVYFYRIEINNEKPMFGKIMAVR